MGIDEYKQKKFETQLGQVVNVERTESERELDKQCNEVLRDIGRELKPAEGVEYVGSFCVHVYQSPVLQQLFFVSQSLPTPACTPLAASTGISDLTKTTQRKFGIAPQVKRSGW